MGIVVDASVLVDVFTDADHSGSLRQRLSGEPLHAPAIIDAEVLHGVRRRLLAGAIDAEGAGSAVSLFQVMHLKRHVVTHLVARMWDLRHNITAYDAAYVALAESLDLPLITRDARLARAAGHAARIDLIA